MRTIETTDALEALYDVVSDRSITKVARRITPHYQAWIDRSRFTILTTVGPEGTDASPRGDDGPVARIVDDQTIWLPDWRGNNRLDSLRNIVRDGRVSLMFMVPGSNTVVRTNGRAVLTDDPAVVTTFTQAGRHPRTVMVFTLDEIYFQCAKALMRSRLWSRGDDTDGLPTAGDFLREQDDAFDAETYDSGYAEYAKSRMW